MRTFILTRTRHPETWRTALALAVLLSARQTPGADLRLPRKPELTLVAARQIATAAIDFAHANKAPGAAVSIVDEAGAAIYLERLDGTFPRSSDISIGKARTAALFRRATREFEDAINGGRIAMTALEDFTPLEGGVPLVVNGSVVGAIGVSGSASADQDNAIAEVGAQTAARLYEVPAP